MRKYIEVAKVIFKAQLAWRFDVCFNMLFTVAKILFAYILWGAVFGEKDEVAGFTFNAMISYYIVSSFISQLEMSEGISGEISSRIRNGTFSRYMVMPASVPGYFTAQTAGASAFYLSFNLAAAVVWTLLFRIRLELAGDIALIAAAVAICAMGLVFMIQFNYFLGILTFKFNDNSMFLMLKNNIIEFITGTMVPLSLLPGGIVRVMRYLPFYYVTYMPSMLFTGRCADEAVVGMITLTAWVLVFIPLNKLTYNRLRIKYDGVGI